MPIAQHNKSIRFFRISALVVCFIYSFLSLGQNDFDFDDKTPRQYIEEASKRLKTNYGHEKYLSTSFLRVYKKMNGEYVSLQEVQGTILFNIEPESKSLPFHQAITVRQIRQTDLEKLPYYREFGFRYAFLKDPIAYPKGSILDPKVIRYTKYEFDYSPHFNQVVVRYEIDQLTPKLFGARVDGVGRKSTLGKEVGTITIDKNTFAIIRIESEAVAQQEYNPTDRRYEYNDKTTFAEDFQSAKLVIEYGELLGTYYLRKMYLHQVVERYKTGTYTSMGNYEFFREYHFAMPTQSIPDNAPHDFLIRPAISRRPCLYDPSKWKMTLPPFYFQPQRDVYFAMERHQTLEEQFSCDPENTPDQETK